MSLPPALPHPASARLPKALWVALVLVLGVHFLLLGDTSLRALWASAKAPASPSSISLATRILPPDAPPAPSPAAATPTPPPARKLEKRSPKPRPAAPAKPAAAAPDNSPPPDPVTPEPTAETAPDVTPEDATVPVPVPVPAPSDPAHDMAPVETTDTAALPQAAPPEPTPRFTFPAPVQLNYDVFGETDGQKNVVGATIVWKHDDAHYDSSLLITKFGFRLRQWTSKGALTATGLTPVRFGDKGFRSSEVAAHFVWDEHKVIFSANTPESALTPGAQDQLSVFMQLASLWAGDPTRYAAGSAISIQSIGPRQSEMWTFVVSPDETITVPGGTLQAIKLTRDASGDYSTKAEVWLTPQLAYLPARIRLSEANGNVLDMVWTSSQTPP